MRASRTFVLLITMMIINSCQFNQSVKSDLTSGAYSRGDGLGSDDVVMQINGKAEKRNEFVYGEKVNLIFNDVTGLSNSDGKTYPQMSIYIVKNEKDTVLANPTLLKNLENGTDLSPLQLQTSFTAAFPFSKNETYIAHIKISDNKGDGTFTYKLPFTIKKNGLLNIENNGIEYSNIYLWNETLKQPLVDAQVNSQHLLILILDGIEGLEPTNERVFPIFSIELTDASGNEIISNPNMLSDFENEGVKPEELKAQLTAKLTFSEGKVNNPCKLIAKVKDRNSQKEIIISTELSIDYN